MARSDMDVELKLSDAATMLIAEARQQLELNEKQLAVIKAAKALVAYSRDNVDWYRKVFVPLREALQAAEEEG